MIKKIVITYYDGSFGPSYTHWEEKMTITPDKVSYEINDHFKSKVENRHEFAFDENYKRVKYQWSYKIDSREEEYQTILYFINKEVEKLSLEHVELDGCDIGDTSIKIYDDEKTNTFSTAGPLTTIKEFSQLYELIDMLMPDESLRPHFMGEIQESCYIGGIDDED